jgi:hypothetical protein
MDPHISRFSTMGPLQQEADRRAGLRRAGGGYHRGSIDSHAITVNDSVQCNGGAVAKSSMMTTKGFHGEAV